MNKKLAEMWDTFTSKLKIWKWRRKQLSDIEVIAKAMDNDDEGISMVPFESTAEYGVHPNRLGEFAIQRGGHVMQTSLYYADGRAIKYPSKIKRNDGSIETIVVLTAEQAEKLALDEEREREAKLGFPPRCPDCKAVLPEGTILGGKASNKKNYQRPYQYDDAFNEKEF